MCWEAKGRGRSPQEIHEFPTPSVGLLNEAVSLPGHDQSTYRLRMEWGPTGATAVPADYAVVVDVLSFTTTLSVALERGIEVFPFRWRDSRAAEHALRHGATLAVGRFEALSREDARHVSLSPASLSAVEGIERLVLPSPNGSTIAFALAESGAQVLGACLRNAGAVARWLAPQVADGASVVVVPAGERWYDDTLRPAVEDLWGAGAVLAGLVSERREVASPEALMAVAAWQAASLPADLLGCASGLELAEVGFVADVEIAGQHDVSEVVPVLVGESFRDGAELEPPSTRLRRV
jgi:2-phosphosulfolactate phosphatase